MLWSDRYADRLRCDGGRPKRASQVFVIEEGPYAGRFAVDFSLLGPEWAVCPNRTFARYDEAVAFEIDWIEKNWIACS